MSVYFRSEIYSQGYDPSEPAAGRGPVVVRQETNDNDDDGYDDGAVEVWYLRFATVEDAIKSTGRSHRGYYGQPVDVYLDGEHI